MLQFRLSTVKLAKTAITGGVVGLMYIQPFRPIIVSGRSMEPTYPNHSMHWAQSVAPSELKRGDVVIIRTRSGPIVKRIAYMPGDLMGQVRSGGTWIDLLDIHPVRNQKETHLYRRVPVPDGMIYVLGDNWDLSYDSRKFGFLPIDSVEEKLVDQKPLPTRIDLW